MRVKEARFLTTVLNYEHILTDLHFKASLMFCERAQKVSHLAFVCSRRRGLVAAGVGGASKREKGKTKENSSLLLSSRSGLPPSEGEEFQTSPH